MLDDGDMIVSSELDEDIIESHHNGYLDIIDISNPDKPKVFINEEWELMRRVS